MVGVRPDRVEHPSSTRRSCGLGDLAGSRGESCGGARTHHANVRDRLRRARVARDHFGWTRLPARESVADRCRGPLRHRSVSLARSTPAREAAGTPGSCRARIGLREAVSAAKPRACAGATEGAALRSAARGPSSPPHGAEPSGSKQASREEAPPGRIEEVASAAADRGLSENARLAAGHASPCRHVESSARPRSRRSRSAPLSGGSAAP